MWIRRVMNSECIIVLTRNPGLKAMTYLGMDAALDAHERVVDRFSNLLRTASDGSRKVPHLTWSVGEAGAHVLWALRVYPEMLAGVSSGWANLSDGEAENARCLAEIPERRPRGDC